MKNSQLSKMLQCGSKCYSIKYKMLVTIATLGNLAGCKVFSLYVNFKKKGGQNFRDSKGA